MMEIDYIKKEIRERIEMLSIQSYRLNNEGVTYINLISIKELEWVLKVMNNGKKGTLFL